MRNNGSANKNLKPTLILLSIIFLILLTWVGVFKQAEILDKEYSNLVNRGKIVRGEIIYFRPYSHLSAQGKSNVNGGAYASQGIVVKIICRGLNNKEIIEDWDYLFKEQYKVGDSINLYNWDENFWIKATSLKNKRIAKRLIEKEYENPNIDTTPMVYKLKAQKV